MHVTHDTFSDPCGHPRGRRMFRLPITRLVPRNDLFDRAVIAQLSAPCAAGLQLAGQSGDGGPVFDAASGTTHVLETSLTSSGTPLKSCGASRKRASLNHRTFSSPPIPPAAREAALLGAAGPTSS